MNYRDSALMTGINWINKNIVVLFKHKISFNKVEKVETLNRVKREIKIQNIDKETEHTVLSLVCYKILCEFFFCT